jgi:serine protease AprX
MLKIFSTGTQQDEAAARHVTIERYPGFILVAAPPKAADEILRNEIAEDITELYSIPAGNQQIDTSRPRVMASGERAAHPAYKGAKALSRGRHHYLVQFIGPIKAEWLAAVESAGSELRTPYGDFTYVVRATESGIAKIAALDFVRWAGHLPHRARIATALRNPLQATSPVPRTRRLPSAYTVEFFGPDDVTRAAAEVRKLGFEVLQNDPGGKVLIVKAAAKGGGSSKKIEALSAVHGVRKIRETTIKRPSNNVATAVMATNAVTGNPGLNLSGRGEKIAVCDTGIDSGEAATIHPDFAGRISAIKSYPINAAYASYVTNPGGNDGAADLDSGHGTHVAGSVLGNGAGGNGVPGIAAPIRGLAHGARLIFQAIEQEMQWRDPDFYQEYGRYLLTGIPADLKELFEDAYRSGARIHTNSWGGGDPGAYDEQCSQLDEFVWNHKDFCILFAAGNDGTDRDGDGKINPKSVTSPGTAKNCITVGACENRRTEFNSQTYGGWWPQDYPAAPIRNDPMANNPDQVAAFSSRGPTSDGRTKPDIVAPGTFILSARSTRIAQNNTAWAPFQPSRLYFHMGGTSMATPLAAGAVALVREHLRKTVRIRKPSAALLKAAIIAGATRLPRTAPAGALLDNHQGFGRLNLDNILAPPAPFTARFIDRRAGLQTGEFYQTELNLASGGGPLRIVLAYSDFPGPALVNNLNLIVRGPTGTVLAGNQPAGGGMQPDARNNVEVIQVKNAAAGIWRIEVIASNVPQGPQDFALACLGRFSA